MKLEWDDLRVFAAIAREGSLTRAAKTLGMTQPTAGRRLAALEGEVGAPLFERSATGLVLSALGERVLAHVQQMEAAAQAAERVVAGREEGLQGVVTVTSLDWFAVHVLAALLGRFAQHHPQVTLRMMADARTYSLSKREADLAFRFVPFQQLDLAQRRVASMQSALFAAPAYIERFGQPDFGDGLAGHAILTLHEGASHVPEFKWLRDAAPRARIALRSNSTDVLLRAAAEGAGIAVMAVMLGASAPGLVRVPTPEPIPRRDVWMGVHEDLRRVPRVRALMDFLASGLETHPGLGMR